jgi:hypothetical protein
MITISGALRSSKGPGGSAEIFEGGFKNPSVSPQAYRIVVRAKSCMNTGLNRNHTESPAMERLHNIFTFYL